MPLRRLQLVLLSAVIVYSSVVSLNEAEMLLVFRELREGRAKGCRRTLGQKRKPIAYYIELRCDTWQANCL